MLCCVCFTTIKKNKNHVILAVCCSACHYYDLSLQLKQLPLSDMILVVYFSFSFSVSPTGWEGPWEKGICLVTLFSWFLAQCLTQSRSSVNICQITQPINPLGKTDFSGGPSHPLSIYLQPALNPRRQIFVDHISELHASGDLVSLVWRRPQQEMRGRLRWRWET